jgi:hypothetical protein
MNNDELKFKVGDKVKLLIGKYFRRYGDIGIVKMALSDSIYPYYVKFQTEDDCGNTSYWFCGSDLESITSNDRVETQNNFIEIDNSIYLNKEKVVWFHIVATRNVSLAECWKVVFYYANDNIASKNYDTKQEAIDDLIKWGFIGG